MFTYDAQVLENRYLIPGIRYLKLQYPNEFHYSPGQFLNLGIPQHDDKILHRAYSIAGICHGQGIVELGIKEVDGGKFTSQLKNFPPGSSFKSTPAMGGFSFDSSKELVCIAVGIGITPIRGIIMYIAEKQLSINVTLLYGIKKLDNFLFREDFENFSKSIHLRIIPVISRDEHFHGLKGHVQDYLESQVLDKLFDKKSATYFICGMKGLATECKEKLLAVGIDRHQIHIEAFN